MQKAAAPDYLLGDIGGTHSRLACLSNDRSVDRIHVVDNAGYSDLATIIREYLETIPASGRPRAGALAVAGPVHEDHVTLTNLGWSLSIPSLREALKLEQLHIINDFEAVALSVPDLGEEDRLQLWEGESRAGAPLVVLGPGTGLGVATLVSHTGRWLALAGECGHVTLPAVSEKEHAVIARLQEEMGHVSAERLLCGPGLVLLYRTLARLEGTGDCSATTPETVTARAVNGNDALARETLEMFFALLGTVSGNLALTVGARGGLYLAGGILPGLAGPLKASGFYGRFIDKGRYRDYLASIPIYLVTDKYPAFRGLARAVWQAET